MKSQFPKHESHFEEGDTPIHLYPESESEISKTLGENTKQGSFSFFLITFALLFLLIFLMYNSFLINDEKEFINEDARVCLKAFWDEKKTTPSLPTSNTTTITREKEEENLDYAQMTQNESLIGRYYLKYLTNTQFKIQPFSFSTNETCIKERKATPNILCKLGLTKYCTISHIAEMIEYFWIIAPIYAYDQKKTKELLRTS